MSNYIILPSSEVDLLLRHDHPEFSVVEFDIQTELDDIFNNVVKHNQTGEHYMFQYEHNPYWEFMPSIRFDKDENGNVKLHKAKMVEFVSYRWEWERS